MNVCPTLHPPSDLTPGFFTCPVPRPLFLHDPPRPEWDGFNAPRRTGHRPDYQWGDSSMGHRGVDLGALAGADVRAAQSGMVYWVDRANQYATDTADAAGVHTAIILPCPEGDHWFMFRDLHLIEGSIPGRLARGVTVTEGELLGQAGKTGNANWVHDHFEIRHSVNPTANTLTIYPSSWGTPYDPLAWGLLKQRAIIVLSGPNRYETAALTRRFTWQPNDVAVCSGRNEHLADSLTVATYAPDVVITNTDRLSPAASDALSEAGRIIIVGGLAGTSTHQEIIARYS